MNTEHIRRLHQQAHQETWQVQSLPLHRQEHLMTTPRNIALMDEICRADKLDPIIWLPGTVKLLSEARADRDMWRQRAQRAEAQLQEQPHVGQQGGYAATDYNLPLELSPR